MKNLCKIEKQKCRLIDQWERHACEMFNNILKNIFVRNILLKKCINKCLCLKE